MLSNGQGWDMCELSVGDFDRIFGGMRPPVSIGDRTAVVWPAILPASISILTSLRVADLDTDALVLAEMDAFPDKASA